MTVNGFAARDGCSVLSLCRRGKAMKTFSILIYHALHYTGDAVLAN